MGGIIIPHFIVFNGHIYNKGMWEDARETLGDCLIGLSKNGWLNQEIGLKWLKYFKYYTWRTKV